MNNGMVHELAASFARRVIREAGADPAKQIQRVYWVALGRPPLEEEQAVGLDALRKLEANWATKGKGASLEALTTYCRAIVNSAGFLYVD